ncbi:hypothetical protein AVEN_59678-1 [Araneus ventricosus]|uniref:Uncharacterized protein n=1 Tax=Araneus ventricosus TaxID=182803 RepID=A0A4Y2BN36_ARAVE|nr:hypothetical protein AVEN_59678-1 [Araneus ventricosus]
MALCSQNRMQMSKEYCFTFKATRQIIDHQAILILPLQEAAPYGDKHSFNYVIQNRTIQHTPQKPCGHVFTAKRRFGYHSIHARRGNCSYGNTCKNSESS